MSDWNIDLYNRFQAQREQPFNDLISLLPPRLEGRMLDLGCGDGRLTRKVKQTLGLAEAVGIDSSDTMIEAALEAGDDEGITWNLGDLREALDVPESYDLVYSNAALQFVDDHGALLPRVLEKVRPGGWVAIHMPYNHVARTHLLLEAAANAEELASAFDGFSHAWPQERPEAYARALKNAGFDFTSVQLRTYRHAIDGVDGIVSWIKGGAARPYLAQLDDAQQAAFLAKYGRLIHHAYAPVYDDVRLLDYTRLLFVGRRPPADD